MTKVDTSTSQADLAKWKSSDPVRWCFENLETPIDEVDDTLLSRIVAKEIMLDPQHPKIEMDEDYIISKLNQYVVTVRNFKINIQILVMKD